MRGKGRPSCANALRMNSNLGMKPVELFKIVSQEDLAELMQEQRERDRSEDHLTWDQLLDVISPLKRDPGLVSALQEMKRTVTNILGKEEDPQIILGDVAFLIELLGWKEEVKEPEKNEIRIRLNCDSTYFAHALHQMVMAFMIRLPEDIKSDLLELCNDPTKYFGHDFSWTEPNEVPVKEDDFSCLLQIPDSSSDSKTSVDSEQSRKTRCDRNWLLKNIMAVSFEDGLPAEEICSIVIELVHSPRSNAELQTEIYDICGFEMITLIEVILLNRDELKANTCKESKDTDFSALREGNLPYGYQQTFQTGKETQIRKQMSKEAETETESWNLHEDDDFDEDWSFDNPSVLETYREIELRQAAQKQTFKKGKSNWEYQ